MMAPYKRRSSHAGTYRKCHSVDASRLSSAYPIDERFYFMESDGDEADDEFDHFTVSADVENRGQHSQLSLPQHVSVFVFSILILPKLTDKFALLVT